VDHLLIPSAAVGFLCARARARGIQKFFLFIIFCLKNQQKKKKKTNKLLCVVIYSVRDISVSFLFTFLPPPSLPFGHRSKMG
jgi:hypothetical protein